MRKLVVINVTLSFWKNAVQKLFNLFLTTNTYSMYEHKKQPLASRRTLLKRIWANTIFATVVLVVCLFIGMAGYKLTIPEFDWYDSLLNASMILSGMGPVIDGNIHLSHGAKVFASMYALFSGVAFISTIGLIIAPIAHRFFHKLHLEE